MTDAPVSVVKKIDSFSESVRRMMLEYASLEEAPTAWLD